MSYPAGIREIFLRLDANFEIGEGHVVRSAALLANLSTPHRLVLFGEGDRLATRFPTADHSFIGPGGSEKLLLELSRRKPDLIFVDHPKPGAGFWRALRSSAASIPTVAIDDFDGEVDADLIVNSSVNKKFHDYPLASPSSQVLAGPEYILLRSPFREQCWSLPSAPSVTMVVGGGERARDWAFFLASPKHDMSSWGAMRMIVGPSFPEKERLAEACARKKIHLESAISAERMAEAFSHSSLALITGGMVAYEAVAVGVPAVVYPQLENLVTEAEWFASQNCILNLGYDGGENWQRLSTFVRSILDSSEKSLMMSSSQRQTIDGRGLDRAAEAIDAFFKV